MGDSAFWQIKRVLNRCSNIDVYSGLIPENGAVFYSI